MTASSIATDHLVLFCRRPAEREGVAGRSPLVIRYLHLGRPSNQTGIDKNIAEGDLSHDIELSSDKDVLGKALKMMRDNLNTSLPPSIRTSCVRSTSSSSISRPANA